MPAESPETPSLPATPSAAELARRYAAVRRHSLALAEPLSAEDQCVQSMPDASPTKWHLAHTTWFFETLVLQAGDAAYQPHDPRFAFLFNSYYESLGPRHPRPQRGLLTRPSQAEVLRYRAAVDEAVLAFLPRAQPAQLQALELGLHHEQQHQELILTDLKHLLSQNPLQPAYLPAPAAAADSRSPAAQARWLRFEGGIAQVGHDAGDGFSFDNETPRHDVLLRPFELAQRPVSCGEFLAFVQAGGYRDPQWWLSEGWAAVQAGGWQAPCGWTGWDGDAPQLFTLFGLQPLRPDEPVCHLSLYEAAAYAAWADARLPTEFEWETAMRRSGASLRRADEALHPHPRAGALEDSAVPQGLHEVWEWTRSSYDPYPGFVPLGGPAAEYNGKFMVGQVVLRGASCATPPGHARLSYRNFFPPAARWQFSGLRLARDVR